MPTIRLSKVEADALVREALDRGGTVLGEAAASVALDRGEIRTVCMVSPRAWMEDGTFFATIPCTLASEANKGGKMRTKIGRKLSVKAACRSVLGPALGLLAPFAEHYHAGGALRVRFVRLGGRELDPCNLPISLKAVEDMLAGALLAEDRGPQWHVRYDQEQDWDAGAMIELGRFAD